MNEADTLFPVEIVSCHDWTSNAHLVDDVRRLGYIKPDSVVMDVTYGRGSWWSMFRPDHFIAHDRAIDGVDFRRLPEESSSIDVIAFDPPYLPSSAAAGKDAGVADFLDRYGIDDLAPRTFAELWRLIADGLTEVARVVRPGGHVLVKSMSFTEGAELRPVPAMVTAFADALDLQLVDELIHRRQPGPVSQWSGTHSRRNCSTLLVLRRRVHPRRSQLTFRRVSAGPEGLS